PLLWPRLLFTAALLVVYYAIRQPLLKWAEQFSSWLPQHLAGVVLVAILLAVLVVAWWGILRTTKQMHAPLLITSILLIADAGFGVLESPHLRWRGWLTAGTIDSINPTLAAIATTVLTELALGYFLFGKAPSLVSAYISGISAGILI